MSNSLGKLFTINAFGESHGRCVGVVIDGCPAGLPLTEADIQSELDMRKPGGNIAATPRREADQVEIISGTFNKVTTGAPISMVIWNKDTDSSAYEKTRFLLRPGQSDYTAAIKYGGFNDFRGGGMFSGRITAAMVMGGAVSRKLLKLLDIEILAHTVSIGGVNAKKLAIDKIRIERDKNSLRCADQGAAATMTELITKARESGDSLGGVIEGIALNLPAGLGEPIFEAVDSELAKAILAIPAFKGVEFGAGFAAAGMKGSENNDPFTLRDNKIVTTTNNAGGILGGISNGMPLMLRAAVKPTPSISAAQPTVNIKEMKNASLEVAGRHDACIVPRAVVVVESMMALTLCDLALRAGLIPRVVK